MADQIGFTGIKELHVREGSPEYEDITYHPLTPNTHFDGKTFTAPESGLYAFHISFMRDTTKQDDAKGGKGDDCHIMLFVNTCKKDGFYVQIGENSVPRSAAAGTFVMQLEAGNEVTTRDWMYEEKRRVFRHIVFTGYRVA